MDTEGVGDMEPPDTFAIIPVYGIIGKHLSMMETMCGGYDLDEMCEQIDAIAQDQTIQTVIFDFRTPGGTVVGLPEAAAEIAELTTERHTVAFTDTECCSAGYWLASQCGDVFSSPSAIIGSIGVKAYVLDESRALAQQGIVVNAFSSGKYKTMFDSYRPMTDEEKAWLQKWVDDTGTEFRTAVTSTRRNVTPEAMQGQVFRGKEAIDAGLVDGNYSDIDELIAALS
jgi:protease-4